MLATNGGCELPCWLGLYPGTATWEDVADLYEPVSTREISFPPSFAIKRYDFGLSLNPLDILNGVIALFEQDGVIQHIYASYSPVNSREYAAYHPPFASAVRRYSLQRILSDHGVPSRVLLRLPAYPAERDAPWMYLIWIFYDELGILAEYWGEGLSHSGDRIKVCPEYARVHSISLSLQSPESDIPLEDLAVETSSIEKGMSKGWILTLEESTALTREEFYWKLLQGGGSACFESPLDHW